MITQKTINILVENRLNDSKAWYEEHKSEIKKFVLDPFFSLIESLDPDMLSIDPLIVTEPKVDRTLSRIYRDTRFTRDKSRYRDSIWIHFNRDKNLFPGYPSFFFELKPVFAWWGCGFYMADPAVAESCRKMILNRDPIFMKAKTTMDQSSYFVLDEEERFRRTRFPDQPEEFRRWLDRKSIYFAHMEENVETVFTESLADILRADFMKLEPLYRFMCTACERAIASDHVIRGDKI